MIENSAVDILYGLAQSGVNLNSLTIHSTFIGKIGLPRWNGSYYEYRPQYLAINSPTVLIGRGDGAGSGRIKLDQGSVQTAWTVEKTASGAEPGIESVLLKGTNVLNTLQVIRGSVGLAVFAGETSALNLLQLGFVSNKLSDAQVRCGSGVDLSAGTVAKSGGTLTLNAGAQTFTQTDGVTTVLGNTANMTTAKNEGGTFFYASNGTIGLLVTGSGNPSSPAITDFRKTMSGRTVTNSELYENGQLYDSYETVTWTNGVKLVHTNLPSVKLDLGTNIKLNGVTAL